MAVAEKIVTKEISGESRELSFEHQRKQEETKDRPLKRACTCISRTVTKF